MWPSLWKLSGSLRTVRLSSNVLAAQHDELQINLPNVTTLEIANNNFDFSTTVLSYHTLSPGYIDASGNAFSCPYPPKASGGEHVFMADPCQMDWAVLWIMLAVTFGVLLTPHCWMRVFLGLTNATKATLRRAQSR